MLPLTVAGGSASERSLGFSAGELAQIAEGGVVQRTSWLGEKLANAAHSEALERMGGAGVLTLAGVGRGNERHADGAVRGDEVLWLETPSIEARPVSALEALLAQMEALRGELKQGLRVSLERTELQLARYSRPGSGYLPHKDALRVGGTRRITVVYYLNPTWQPGDGGELRAHLARGAVDFEPRLDHVIVFASELVEHEVLSIVRPRLALTAWFGREDPLSRLR